MSNNCVNKITLMGHVGTNPQKIHENPSGVRFRLATNENFFSKKQGDFVKQTEWHSIKAWKQDADYALDNIVKGDYVYIEGKMHYHEVHGEDGRRIRNPEVIANKVTKLNRQTKDDSTDVDEIIKEKNTDYESDE